MLSGKFTISGTTLLDEANDRWLKSEINRIGDEAESTEDEVCNHTCTPIILAKKADLVAKGISHQSNRFIYRSTNSPRRSSDS